MNLPIVPMLIVGLILAKATGYLAVSWLVIVICAIVLAVPALVVWVIVGKVFDR